MCTARLPVCRETTGEDRVPSTAERGVGSTAGTDTTFRSQIRPQHLNHCGYRPIFKRGPVSAGRNYMNRRISVLVTLAWLYCNLTATAQSLAPIAVSCTGLDPSASAVQISRLPEREDVKATRRPLGEYCGVRSALVDEIKT